jgi:transposase
MPRWRSPIGWRNECGTSTKSTTRRRRDDARRAARPLLAQVHAAGAGTPRQDHLLCNFHQARVSNGPTESLNNLIKRIKRIGFVFRNFENYRIRALLYAGKPNWRVLGSIVVR